MGRLAKRAGRTGGCLQKRPRCVETPQSGRRQGGRGEKCPRATVQSGYPLIFYLSGLVFVVLIIVVFGIVLGDFFQKFQFYLVVDGKNFM